MTTNEHTEDIGDMIRRILERTEQLGIGLPVIVNVQVMIPRDMMQPQEEKGELEVHRIGDDVTVTGGFPGFSRDDLQVFFSGDHVVVAGKAGDRIVRASADVPAPEGSTVAVCMKHGVLEISYRAACPAGEAGAPCHGEAGSH